MRLTDEDLKQLVQETTRAPEAGAPVPPVDSDTIARAAAGGLGRAERDCFVDRVISDPVVAEEWRSARTLESWAARAAAVVGARQPVRKRLANVVREWPWMPAAAAALAALVVAVIVLPKPASWTPGDGGPEVLRSSNDRLAFLVTTAPVDGSAIARPVFQWQPVAGAERYRVTVFRENGSKVWTSGDVTNTAVRLPDGVTLPAGSYYWQVAALHAGETAGESRLLMFRVP